MGEPPLIPELPSTPGLARTQWVLGTVGIAIAVGVVAFGAARLAAPTSDTGTATTTAIAAPVVTVGVPLTWEQGTEIEGIWPVALIERTEEERLYLFGTPSAPFGRTGTEGGGLDAWTSNDGIVWQSLGTVIAPLHRYKPSLRHRKA